MDSELAALFATADPPNHEPEFKFYTVSRPNGLGSVRLRTVSKHVLWGNYLWNSSRWLARHFDLHPFLVRDKRILELGAGAALPSIVAALNGASSVTITDYPDCELVENIRFNVATNVASSKEIRCVGYLWGSPLDSILDGGQYDTIILCDLVFNHSELAKLADTCRRCLKPDGTVWCAFSHHRPWLAERDLRLFEIMSDFRLDKVAEEAMSPMFEGDSDVIRTVHVYMLRRA